MLELNAQIRRETGRENEQLRKKGFIPAVLYGKKIDNLILSVKAGDFESIYQTAGESTLIKLKISGGKETPAERGKEERVVLVQDIAKDPVSEKIIHIDFNQVNLTEAIIVEIPLVFVGKSEAIERDNGVLVKSISLLEVEALPDKLPHEIQVDISVLKTFNDSIRVRDIKVSDEVEVKGNPDDVIATVVPPRTQEELEKLGETPTESVEGIEVEVKGKEKTEGKESEEPAPAGKEPAGKPTEEKK
ncbi:50S ribosomal protein L25 [Patescibacteria group bacterium]|nr:50S ribosomal protein L25 [Patescibacteria group bacterium]